MKVLENGLNLHHLRVFHVVARHLSFSRAAEELFISQPAVSMHVKQLESAVGMPLFEKQGRRVRLTDAGHRLYAYGQRIFVLLQETVQAMEAMRGGNQGRLRVAADTTAGVYVVPEFLGMFRRASPQVTIFLEVINRSVAVKRLLEGEVDLAIVGRVPGDESLEIIKFLVNELVIIAWPDHPLVGVSRLPVSELARETFLLREPGSGTRATAESVFSEAGVEISTGMELGSNSAIKEAVANGLGIAVISRRAIDLELQAGRLAVLDVDGFPHKRYWHVVHMRDRFMPPPAAAFKTLLLAQSSTHRPADADQGGEVR